MWQVCFGDKDGYSEETGFVIHDLLDTQINNLLTNEQFLNQCGVLFGRGITGWEFIDETTIGVQYSSWREGQAITLYFSKLTVI